MFKKSKKFLSFFLSFAMIAQIAPITSYADGSLPNKITEINIKTRDLIVGETLPTTLEYISPSIPVLSNGDTLQYRLLAGNLVSAKGIKDIHTNEFVNPNTQGVYLGRDGQKVLDTNRFKEETIDLYTAAEKNEDGSIKTKDNSFPVFKNSNFELNRKQANFGETIKKNDIYILNLEVFPGVNPNDVTENGVFDNSLSGRTVNSYGKQVPVPKVTLNGKEAFLSNMVGSGGDVSMTIGSKPTGNEVGFIYLYAKEMIAPTLNIHSSKDINEISKDEKLLITLPSFTVASNDVDKYYIAERYWVSKTQGTNWQKVNDLEQTMQPNMEYAIKLVVSPKAAYKFNNDAPQLIGTNSNSAELSRDGENVNILYIYKNVRPNNNEVTANDFTLDMPQAPQSYKEADYQKNMVKLTKGAEFLTIDNVFVRTDSQGKLQVDAILKPKNGLTLNVPNGSKVTLADNTEAEVIVGVGQPPADITIRKTFEKPAVQPNTDIQVEIQDNQGMKITNDVQSQIGKNIQFKAKVTGQSLTTAQVDWKISGATDAATKIDANGMLSISNKETSSLIIVEAVSKADQNAKATANVIILNPYRPQTPNNIRVEIQDEQGRAITNDVRGQIGQKIQFKSKVTGQNLTTEDVEWSISGAKDSATKINSNGMLSISDRETSTLIVVDAISKANRSIRGSIMVKITNPYKPIVNKKYRIKFDSDITVSSEGRTIRNNDMIEKGKSIIITINVPRRKDIARFTINNVNYKNQLRNDKVTLTVNENMDIRVTFEDISNRNTPSNPSRPSAGGGSSTTPNKTDAKKVTQQTTPVVTTPNVVTKTKQNTTFKLNQKSFKKMVNGQVKEIMMDATPFVEKGRVMIPLRYAAEALGMSVEWNQMTKTVTLKDAANIIIVPVNSNEITANGQKYMADVKPISKGGRVYLTISNLTKALGSNSNSVISWDNTAKEIKIDTAK